MRVNQLIYTLEQALHFADFQSERSVRNGIEFMNFKFIPNIKAFADVLSRTKLYEEAINRVKSSDVYEIANNSAILPMQEGRTLLEELESLRANVLILVQALKTIQGNETETDIFIKLPTINDFDELSEFSKQIQTIFGQVIFNSEVDGELKILGAENGSIWLRVFVKTTLAVQLIGSIAWSSAVVYKKILEGRYMEELIKKESTKSEAIEKLKELRDFEINLLIGIEARHIYDEHFTKEDIDMIERLKRSIKMYTELLDKGVEIQPSLLNEEKVSNLFPDIKNLPSITSKIKQIEDKP
jgi:hypothetical protein